MNTKSGLPQLARFGDKLERDHWGHLQVLIPHYETFWQRYVYPLRSGHSIWFRNGIDPDLEDLAIASYSTYSTLARARQKIYSEHDEYRFLEELYAMVQRAAEIGVKLLNQFAEFYTGLRHCAPPVSASPTEQFIESRLKKYRNLLHDAILAMPKDDRRRRLIPKPEHIDQYRRWTVVMYEFKQADFVVA